MTAETEDRLRAALAEEAEGTYSAVPDPVAFREQLDRQRRFGSAQRWLPSIAAAVVVAGVAGAITIAVKHRSAGQGSALASAAQSTSAPTTAPSTSPATKPTEVPTSAVLSVPPVPTAPYSVASMNGPLKHEIAAVNAWTIHCDSANYIVYAGQGVGLDAMARYYPTGVGSLLGVVSYQPASSRLKPFHYEGTTGLGPLKITSLTCTSIELIDISDGSLHSYDLATNALR